MFKLVLFMLIFLTLNAQTLDIYTYDAFVRNKKLIAYLKKFEEKENIKIKFTIIDSKLIAGRIALEGRFTKADLAIGIDDTSIEHAYESGVFIDHYMDIKYKSDVKFDPKYKDMFIAYDYAPLSVIYDSNALGDLPPMTLHKFLESRGKLLYPSPIKDTLGANFLKLLDVHGNLERNLDSIRDKGIVSENWWDGYSRFLKGEASFVLSYQTSPLYHIIEEGKTNYKALEFSDGTIEQIEFMAIPRYAKNRRLAEKLVRFILTKEGMSALVQAEYMLSAVDMDLDLDSRYKVKEIKVLDCNKCKDNKVLGELWIETALK